MKIKMYPKMKHNKNDERAIQLRKMMFLISIATMIVFSILLGISIGTRDQDLMWFYGCFWVIFTWMTIIVFIENKRF